LAGRSPPQPPITSAARTSWRSARRIARAYARALPSGLCSGRPRGPRPTAGPSRSG
jgi:hypothetical protein